ncbi:MAG: alpha-amylase family glycosyl hydrolase [Actinomycetia bacterium]|nr:alpha-amylase family glycosyl hydrolase [Actinomycetes bacterium]
MPWWNDRVFYEIFVRSFADSDGDGIGDFVGMTDRLDYLNDGDPTTTDDLSITGIWLMPVFDSPSYHGYDVVDYRATQPEYGTIDELRHFIDEAHKRGIAVIMDLIINHSSSQHPWFSESGLEDSPTSDWYIWEDEAPDWRGLWGQNVWHERDDNFYYGIFWKGMPDLNLRSDAVTAEMYDIAAFWLDDVNADGFRLDAARHLIENGAVQVDTPETYSWLGDFTGAMHGISSDVLILGEIWTDSETISSYVPDSVDLAFEFGLADAFLSSMSAWNAHDVEEAQREISSLYRTGQFAPFLTNHDQDRVMSQLGGNVERAHVAAVWLLTTEGVPFVYYGEEVGLSGVKPDERIRTPMPWTDDSIRVGFTTGVPWEPPDLGFATANVETQTDDADSLLSTHRDLIRYRSTSNALRFGTTTVVETSAPEMYVVLRTYGDENVLVLLNLSGRDVTDYSVDLGMDVSPGAISVFGRSPDSVTDATAYKPVTTVRPFEAFVIELTTSTDG